MARTSKAEKTSLVNTIAELIVDHPKTVHEKGDIAHVRKELSRMDLSTLELIIQAYQK